MLGKCLFYEFVTVSENGKDVFFLNREMINEMDGPKPIGVALDAVNGDISLETLPDFPAQQQTMVMVAAHRLEMRISF